MKKEIELNEDIYIEARDVLLNEGIDVNTAINMFFKKIVKEKTIGFMFEKTNVLSRPEMANNSQDVRLSLAGFVGTDKMTKKLAKRYFADKGINIFGDCFFASENNTTHIFWANIHCCVLLQDWWLMLNDKTKRVVNLFKIPANTFVKDEFVMRADQPEIIDLQIAYNDPTFTDNRSHISFKQFYIDKILY